MVDEPETLGDGTYDTFVVDASIDGDGADQVTHLELTITMGEHKGEVLSVAATGMVGDEYELIGMPATLVVTDGVPVVTIDD